MMRPMTHFVGGRAGMWRVRGIRALRGPGLAPAERVSVYDAEPESPGLWALRGVGSHQRYTTRPEADALAAVQEGLGRPAASCAALIPIRKSPRWWALAQDERRAVFEERSGHNRIGMDYLPAVSRKLFHSRDFGEPFDFITWFEFAPADAPEFDDMLARLRATEEWTYVEREVEVRLDRPSR